MTPLLIVTPDTLPGIFDLYDSTNGEKVATTMAADPMAALTQFQLRDYTEDVGPYNILFIEQQDKVSEADVLRLHESWGAYMAQW